MRTAALKDVAPARSARLSAQPDETVWHLNLDQIESQSGRVLEKVSGLASTAGSSTQAFDTGNVLYSKLRPYLNKVVCPDSAGIATTELVPLRPDPEQLDRQYLTYYLRSPDFVNWVSNKVAGAKMPRVSMKVFWDHEIPLPPLAEQKRIAGILDAADALRAKRRESLAQLDALLQSTFLTLFGDPVSNPMGWPTSSFENCIQDRTSSAIKIPKSDFQPEGQWQIIDQSQNEIAGYSNIGPPFKESLPAVVFGDHTRCVKLVREPFLFGADGAKLLIPYSQMLAVFLSHLLPLLKLPDLGYSRHMREVKRLVYILPPLALQQRFAAVVESVERQKSAQRAHLAELDALFAALQHRAFRGEL
jgi:type I restriction enzyme S subunit